MMKRILPFTRYLWYLLIPLITAAPVPFAHDHGSEDGADHEECWICLAVGQVQAALIPDIECVTGPTSADPIPFPQLTNPPVLHGLDQPNTRGPPSY